MRGRRAFVVVTVYLLLLSAFAFGIYAYLRQQASLQESGSFVSRVLGSGLGDMALSADIGHAVFSGLLLGSLLGGWGWGGGWGGTTVINEGDTYVGGDGGFGGGGGDFGGGDFGGGDFGGGGGDFGGGDF